MVVGNRSDLVRSGFLFLGKTDIAKSRIFKIENK